MFCIQNLVAKTTVLLLFLTAFSTYSHCQTIIQDRAVEKRLSEKTQLEFEETEFLTVINEIRDDHKVNISVHQSAKDAGLDDADLVTINIAGVSLKSALTLFLDQYDCTYLVKDGFLQIMTKDESSQIMRVKSYDCRELVKLIDAKTIETVYFNGKPQNSSERKSIARSGLVVVDNTKTDKDQKAKNDENRSGQYLLHKQRLSPSENLAHVIMQMTGRKSWSKYGGSGSIVDVNGWIMIRHHGDMHHEVEKIIELLKLDLQKKSK